MTRLRTKAACLDSAISDLHYKLGRAVEDAPGSLRIHEQTMDTSKRHFDGLALDVLPRPTPSLDALIEEERKQNPAFDRECQAEWDSVDVPALIAAQRERRKGRKS